MEQPATILNRLALRRAAIEQLSGVAPHVLDELVAAHRHEIAQRRDARISSLQKRLNQLTSELTNTDADTDVRPT